jgi:hypothetical protein
VTLGLRAAPYNGGVMNRSVTLTVAVVCCALVLVACGSSGKPGTTGPDPALKLAQCMRAHGVRSFPDPTPGGGIQIPSGSGINPQSPAFQDAQKACAKFAGPFGGPRSGHPSAQVKAQLLAVSECMRAHGISGFPDPTTSPPPNPSDYSAAIGRDGVFLAIPKTINAQSPEFKQAAAACQLPLLR